MKVKVGMDMKTGDESEEEFEQAVVDVLYDIKDDLKKLKVQLKNITTAIENK